MKAILIGSALSSIEIFKVLISHKKITLDGVVTFNKKNIGDRFSLEKKASENDIDCLTLNNNNEKKIYNFIKKKKPDLIFCVGWNYILSKKIYKLSTIMSLGFHPCPYPYGKGRSPIIWSIILGVDFIYNIFFEISDKVDSGNIISKKKICLSRNETSTSLYNKILKKITPQTKQLINSLSKGNFILEKQRNTNHYWRKRTIEDGRINFMMSFDCIMKLFKALDFPYPGSTIFYKNKDYKVNKIKKINNKEKKFSEPGKILAISGKKVVVKCFDETIEISLKEKINGLKIGEYF